MPKLKNILIDFTKIQDPYSGLGQFCSHLKIYFDQNKTSLNLNYWLPNKWQKLAKKIPFLLPRSEVFHAVHQDSPYAPFDFAWNKKTKYLLTIHDLNALYEKTQFGNEAFYKKSLQGKINKASHITFISHFAKNETEKYFDLKKTPTSVVYNGIAVGNKSEAPHFIPTKPFLFSIGTVLPKKNFHVLIDFLKLIPDYQLVIAGTTYHSYAREMKKRIEDEGLAERIFLIGTIPDSHKLWYYQNAKAFLFPSLLEGFGLPVAEAMSLGLPLFISDKTSLPEIGGEDAYYFKNFDPDSMRDIFIKGMMDFSLEKKLRLIERSALFDWKKAADAYLQLYNNL